MNHQQNNNSAWYGLGRGFADDQTREQDRQEKPFHNPQIHDGYHPVSVWTHRIDNQSISRYNLRQSLSLPFTLAGWLRTGIGFPLIGAVVKHSVWQSIIWMGWYAAIPTGVFVLPLVCAFFIALRDKDMRYPAVMKYTFMLLGGIL